MTLDAGTRRQLNEQVAQLYRQGRYQEALPLARQAAGSAEGEVNPAETPADPEGADSLEHLGNLERELGHYPPAEAALLRALSLRASLAGKDPAYARTLGELGLLYEEMARYTQAEQLFRRSLALRREALGPDHPDVAESEHDLGQLLDLLARFDEAEPLHHQALETRRKLGEDHPDFARSLAAQSWGLWRHGRIRQADEQGRRALEILRKSLGEEHPDFATTAQLASRLALHQARLDEAERLARQVVAVRARVLGEQHHRHGAALENLALVRAVAGHADEALELARQGVEVTRSALGDQHPYLADSLAALGYAEQAARNPAEAERCYHEALAIYQAVHGEKHTQVAGCCRDLAEVCAAQERYAEAEEHYRRALSLLEGHGESVLLERVENLQGLSRVQAAQGQFAEAEKTALHGLELAGWGDKGTGGQGDKGKEEGAVSDPLSPCPPVPLSSSAKEEAPMLLAGSLDALARLYQTQGRLAEAEPLWREVLDCRRRALGEDHPLYADALRCLAGLHQAQGNFPEAMRLHQQALAIVSRTLGEKHAEHTQALTALAELDWQRGELAGAEELYTRVVEAERERVGEDSPEYAQALLHLARYYLATNNVHAAEVRYRQALEVLRRVHGEEHPEFAQALHDLGSLYHQVGDLSSAENLYTQAREIRRERPGEHHPDYAQSIHSLAMVYQAQGRLDEALPLFRQAVEIQQAELGPDHPATLRSRHSEALFHQARGDFRRAEEQLTDVRDRLDRLVGPQAPVLAPVLSDLARLYGAVGDHLSAEPLWQRVRDINRAAFPGDAMLHAQDLVNLALARRALGEFGESEDLVRESLEFVRQERGEEHPDVAAALGLLASLVQSQDRHDEAERLYRRALELTRTAFGQNHPAVATLLGEQAALAVAAGRPTDALEMYRQACEVARRGQGEDSGEHINLLRLRAGLLQVLGRFDEAEPLLKQRVTTLRRLFGPTSAVMVPGQQSLSDLYRAWGRLDEAEGLCRQALQTLRRQPEAGEGEGEVAHGGPPRGQEELAQALTENNLAMILLAQGKYGEAEPLLRQALDKLSSCVGTDHPSQAGVLFNLAGLCAVIGREAEALELLERLIENDNRVLTQLLTLASERFRAVACHGLHENYENYLGLWSRTRLAKKDLSASAFVYDLVLRRKRFGIEVLAAPPLEGWQAKYPQQAAELRRLWLLDRQIATKRWNGPGFEGLATHGDLIEAWLEQRETLEERLAATIPELALRRRLRHVGTATVNQILTPGWALVEYVHFRQGDFRGLNRPSSPGTPPPVTPPDPTTLPGRYLAFVLRAGEAAPQVVDLGPAAALDERAAAWCEQMRRADAPGAAGQALREVLLDPVLPLVADCKGLVLAPDGELIQVPLDALPLEGGCLLDRFELRQVIAGRDLLRRGRATAEPGEPIVVGDPNGTGPVAGSTLPDTGGPMPPGSPGLLDSLWQAMRRMVGGPAPAPTGPAVAEEPAPPERPEPTWHEAEAVARRLGVPARAGSEVGRAWLAAQRSPRLLHLSLPAFFLGEQAIAVRAAPASRPGMSEPLLLGWENPLERAGLNLTATERVTAQELTRLDLWDTRLVLLPAVVTLPGQLNAWSKVSGLVNAFVHAGAHSVVLSLWRGPEASRRELVLAFYEELLAGRSVPEALRQARLAVRARHPEPLHWAGWVCAGEFA